MPTADTDPVHCPKEATFTIDGTPSQFPSSYRRKPEQAQPCNREGHDRGFSAEPSPSCSVEAVPRQAALQPHVGTLLLRGPTTTGTRSPTLTLQLEVLGANHFKGKDGGAQNGHPKHYMELIFLLTSLTSGQYPKCL